MTRKRSTAKLPPLQYRLRFPSQDDVHLPPAQRKRGYLGGTYIVFRDGRWMAFRNRWKADWDAKHGNCAAIVALTVRELTARIQRCKDSSFKFNPRAWR
jgi:hypothetical protein